MEDYKRKYEDALERARELNDKLIKEGTFATSKGIESIFPELKERGDEKVRKELLEYLKLKLKCSPLTDKQTELINKGVAWLEKQCEHKPNPYSGTSFEYGGHVYGMCARDGGVEILIDSNLKAFVSLDKTEIHPLVLNKTAPKFKVGDWVVNKQDEIARINQVKEDSCGTQRYYIEFTDGTKTDPMPCFADEEFHLWTIQDAKDGDVLNSTRVQATIIFKGFNHDCKHIDAYCALQSGIFIHQEMLWDRDFEPAPKVWENNLFAAMKEAGYEWDAEKKELKKVEQKSAWSEEDEIRAAQIISDLEKCTVPGFPVYIGGVELEINWLKSLKERYTWKPSDEQMKQLGWIAEQNKDNMIGKELMTLYNDLKKLREK